ncbi:zinc-binding metallopeptidase family protein [Hymenobacter crusticola]|uniref:Zinc-ribbon domain-containing protein n=1 Tax=Hymenobacter crusticola TaxID=1770526 RepID=A0A243WDC5_9BACT|nr:putative zinc-binding peptidase [Hymenobacter crusticola]OUJ73678.1 hypothetical protein BXP70_11860 [Hymenobacter crusticola]
MKLFKCNHCGQTLFFENNVCEKCKYPLGFEIQELKLLPLVKQEEELFTIYNKPKSTQYKYCANHAHDVCNWLVPADNDSPFCVACSLNRTIPDLSKPSYVERWKAIEVAKHRLVFSLLQMKLPVFSKAVDQETGLSFDFVADENEDKSKRILTGHANGLITLNIAEADDIEREMARKAMDELYRTVLGHFRHEVGHYYWDRLIDNTEHLEEFRQLFGDEQEDYGEALKKHYAQGPPADWNQHYISAYATSHPWEDWAETWAHYLHIMDTLQTASAFRLSIHPEVAKEADHLEADLTEDPYKLSDFTTIMNMWLPLTFTMNSLNRSMGLHDPYPFIIYPEVMQKMAFIHRVCDRAKS